MATELELRLRHSGKVISMARQAGWHRWRIATTMQQRMSKMTVQGTAADSIRDKILKDTQLPPTEEDYHKWEKRTQRTIHRHFRETTSHKPQHKSDGNFKHKTSKAGLAYTDTNA